MPFYLRAFIFLVALHVAALVYTNSLHHTGPHQRGRVLILCLIWAPKVNDYLSILPESWKADVAANGKLLFVVGRNAERFFVALPKNFGYLQLDVPDDQFPPVDKEMAMYEAITQKKIVDEYDFVLKLDSDTYLEPSRLTDLIRARKLRSREPLYMGSPLHHCQCTPSHSGLCDKDEGVHYCSGAITLLSQRTGDHHSSLSLSSLLCNKVFFFSLFFILFYFFILLLTKSLFRPTNALFSTHFEQER